jgi:hypothetical protein
MPKRIQRKRARGWKMPPNTVYVGRPSKWGNPYTIGQWFPKSAVTLFAAYAESMLDRAWLEPLRGKNLACWCKLDEPCHADVLLYLANL